MAQVGSSGGRRDSNVDLNLVPFIDLMSVMITFLLVTAVWSQVAMIKLGSSIYGKQSDIDPTPPKPTVPLRVNVTTLGYQIRLGAPNNKVRPYQEIDVPKLADGRFDVKGLLAKLQQIKDANPGKDDAVMGAQESLTYDDMITGMDTILRAGFSQVSVATGGFE